MHRHTDQRGLKDWDDVRYFLTVVRSGSYSRAANRLGTRQSTISRRIQALEQRLGVKLFDHRGHGMRPTPAADAMVPHAERMEAEALAVERELVDADAEPRGVVRITATEGLVAFWIMQWLTDFYAVYPSIFVETAATSRLLDLGARDADVALRFGEPRDPRLIAKWLGTVRYRFYAGRSYVSAHGAPRTLDELYAHPVIDVPYFHAGDDVGLWRSFIQNHQHVVARIDTLSAILQALSHGMAITLLPPYVGETRTDLVDLGLDFGYRLNLYLLSHEETQKSARIRAFCDYVQHRAALDRDTLFANERAS